MLKMKSTYFPKCITPRQTRRRPESSGFNLLFHHSLGLCPSQVILSPPLGRSVFALLPAVTHTRVVLVRIVQNLFVFEFSWLRWTFSFFYYTGVLKVNNFK